MKVANDSALEARALSVQMGERTVCRGLDVLIRPGECWGVLGQNGMGKTTLLRTLAGLHTPQSGGVSWNGLALGGYARRDLAQRVAILTQGEGDEFYGSVQEYVLLGRFPHRTLLFGYSAEDEQLAQQSMAQMELTELAGRPHSKLSGGERQRAAVAQVLTQRAQCYLLDEPLQHLDLRHQAKVMRVLGQLREQASALVMVLHDTLWAQRYCDHVLMLLPDGQVLQGGADELLTRTHLEAVYQCRLHEVSVDGERCFVAGV